MIENAKNLSLLGSAALIPASTIEQVAGRAAPWVRLATDMLVWKTGAAVLVFVSNDVVQAENSGKDNHAYHKK